MKANTLYQMNANGIFEELKKRPELPKGTIVYAFGAGNEKSTWATTGEGNNIVKLSENYDDAYFCNPFSKLDAYARPISEKFGIGFYYDLNATKATDEEINAAIERGKNFLAEMDQKKRKQEEEHAQALREIREKYAGIFAETSEKYGIAAHVAKNIRKDLAMNFPGQKFSVKKEDYSSIRVSWTDGPAADDVRRVAEKHKLSGKYDPFNPDLMDYEDTAFTEVFGGVEYLWIEREYAADTLKACEAEVLAACPGLAEEVHYKTAFDLPGFSELYNEHADALRGMSWYNVTSVARNILSKKDLSKKQDGRKDTEKVQERKPGGLELVDYSEKAFAIIGETRSISEKLKSLGGKFNARLSCGAGWIFSKKKEDAVRVALGF